MQGKTGLKLLRSSHGEGKCESLSCDGVAESKGKRHPDLGLKGSRPRRWRHVGLADLRDSTPANTWQVQERAFSRAKIRLIGHNRADGDSRGVALGSRGNSFSGRTATGAAIDFVGALHYATN